MAKKTEAEKNRERQNIRDVHEANIKIMRDRSSALVSEIEHLTMQKIFLDNNIQVMNEQYLDFKKVIDVAISKYTSYDDLKGNFMDYIESETEAITGHGDNCLTNMNLAGMIAETAQTKLDKKIEHLKSELTSLLREISDAQILYQNALNLIV